jgi:hypothetical protein
MNWLIGQLLKEARGRRFRPKDRVRYFTDSRKGKGRGVVLTPSFSRGEVVDFNPDTRQYSVRNDKDETIEVHPRNLIPDFVGRVPLAPDMPSSAPAVVNAVEQGEIINPS